MMIKKFYLTVWKHIFISIVIVKNNSFQDLNLAGHNRYQLEHVINHYSKSPEDSLKLKAAEFLIINMPGKYSESYEAPWEDVATVNLRWTSSSDKLRVLETYKLGEPVRKDDITYITVDFLISNNELINMSNCF